MPFLRLLFPFAKWTWWNLNPQSSPPVAGVLSQFKLQARFCFGRFFGFDKLSLNQTIFRYSHWFLFNLVDQVAGAVIRRVRHRNHVLAEFRVKHGDHFIEVGHRMGDGHGDRQ